MLDLNRIDSPENVLRQTAAYVEEPHGYFITIFNRATHAPGQGTRQWLRTGNGLAITAFGGVLSAAEQERERAEVERLSNAEFYDRNIAPQRPM